MDKINAIWSESEQKKAKQVFGKGYLILKIDEFSKKTALKKYQKLIDQEVSIEIKKRYRSRTLDQNALMWSLYQVEAKEHNGGLSGGSDVKANDLYEADLMEFAPRMIITTDISHWNILREDYRVTWEKEISNKIKAEIIISSSHFNTTEMKNWIDRIINRIAENGLSENNEPWLHDKFLEWKKFCYKKPSEDYVGKDIYRARNVICEATGKYLGDHGQIAHIQARGMGGNWASDLDMSWNLLYLSNEAHIGVQHQKGWSEFCYKYPHLKDKVEYALRKEVGQKEKSLDEKAKDAIQAIDSALNSSSIET